MTTDKRMKCVVSDIDNTLIDVNLIFREIYEKRLRNQDAWDYFEDNCDRPGLEVIKPVLHILRHFNDDPDVEIVFVTARSESVRYKTQALLDLLGFSKAPLFMRAIEDAREPHKYKLGTLKEISEFYKIILFLDDEINNREAAKSLGIFSPKPADWSDMEKILELKR